MKLFFVLVLFSFAPQLAHAQTETIDLSLISTTTNVTNLTEIARRPNVETDYTQFNYTKNEKPDLIMGYTTDRLWVRLNVSNSSAVEVEKILYLNSPLTGFVELYLPDSNLPLVSGSSIPIDHRNVPSRLSSFFLKLKPGESKTIYLSRQSHHQFSSKLMIAPAHEIFANESENVSFLYFYFGGIICLLIYNLLLGLYSDDKVYLYYFLFASTVAGVSMNITGFLDSSLFPGLPFTFSHYLMIFSSSTVVTSLLFCYQFLDLKRFAPNFGLVFKGIAFLSVICFFQGFFSGNTSYQFFFGNLIDATIVLTMVAVVTAAAFAFKNGQPLGAFFLLSWVPILTGVGCWFLKNFGVLPSNKWTLNAIALGNLGEMLILSLGLAYKIVIMDQERKKALDQAKEKDRYQNLVKILSHDISNGLLLLNGYLKKIESQKNPVQQSEFINKAKVSLKNLLGILGFVRAEEAIKAFEQSVRLKPILLAEVLMEISQYYEDLAHEKKIDIQLDLIPDIWILGEKSVLMHQIFGNFLSNAIKFSPLEGVISIEMALDQGQTIVLIKDQGLGMKTDEIQKYFQSTGGLSKSGTLSEKGSGLGISIARQYLNIFNGKLTVESKSESDFPGKCGTTIKIEFTKIDQFPI